MLTEKQKTAADVAWEKEAHEPRSTAESCNYAAIEAVLALEHHGPTMSGYSQDVAKKEAAMSGTMLDELRIHDAPAQPEEDKTVQKEIEALKLAMETAFCTNPSEYNCRACELTMPLRKLAESKLAELTRKEKP